MSEHRMNWEPIIIFALCIAFLPALGYLDDEIEYLYSLLDQEKNDECIKNSKEIIARSPNNAQARFCFASALNRQYKLHEALKQYDYLQILRPDCAPINYNKAFTLKSLGRFQEAAECYELALEEDPDHHNANYGFAQALLGSGDFRRAWPYFEWRCKDILKHKRTPIDPASLEGKTVLLRAEFGFGDTVQFMRYAKLLKQYGARKVIMQTFTPLIPMFSTCDFIDQLIPINS